MIIIDVKGQLSANEFYKARSHWVRKEIVDRWHKAFNEAFLKLANEKGVTIADIRYNEPIELLLLVPTSSRLDMDNLSAVEKLVIDCIKDQKVKAKEPGQKKGKMVLTSRGIIEDDNQKYLVGMAKRFDEEIDCIQVIISAWNRFDMELDTAFRFEVIVPEKPKTGKQLVKNFKSELERKYQKFHARNSGGNHDRKTQKEVGNR